MSAKRVPRLRGVDVELAAHAPRQLAPDREAEPEAAGRPGGAAAVEALEDALALLGRDARPRVGDGDHARPVAGVRLDRAPARRAGRSAARCRAGSARRGRPRRGRRGPSTGHRRDDVDRRRALARAQLELGGDRADDLAQLDGLRAQRHRGVEAREVEQLAGERREAVELAARGVDLAQRVSSSSRPARRSSSSSSIVPWSIVSGVRSSCLAVETNARRAASWRRSSSCMRASARARSPTSSRRSSCGICASGPSSVIRSAAARRRASRRSSVEESAMASSAGDGEADDGGDQEAGAHLADERRDLGELALGDAATAVEPSVDGTAARATITVSPSNSVTGPRPPGDRAHRSAARRRAVNSLS